MRQVEAAVRELLAAAQAERKVMPNAGQVDTGRSKVEIKQRRLAVKAEEADRNGPGGGQGHVGDSDAHVVANGVADQG